MKLKPLLIQAAIAAVLILAAWGAVQNARTNLEALGLTSGFDFLERSTGWGYSFSLIERSIEDTYARTLAIGFMNTLFLGLLTIFTATILGVVVGALRDVRNLALRGFADSFVHIFRNIPLILQLVFWYSVFIHLPGPRQAYSLGDMIFLTNRGFLAPTLNISVEAAAGVAAAAALVVALILVFSAASAGRKLLYCLAGVVAVCLIGALAFRPPGEDLISTPVLRGLRFRGGVTLSVEFMAMVVAITLYGAAYIAEVVRGGLREVPLGQIEAGRSLGLSEFAVWRLIKMPLALRTILPPLGNQWIFIMKATTLGVAIGFSDLFMLISTSITQSGQTLELISLLMAAFLLINFTMAQLVNLMNARLALKER